MNSYQDGASLFGGGGFMPTQSATQFADPFSPARTAGSRHSGLLPVTVKQMSMAAQISSDDVFLVDGVDINNATLVGMVSRKEVMVTGVSFILDDGTGRTEVKRWIDSDDAHENMEMNSIQNGGYVRVQGHLRSFQGKRNVIAFSVRPITDFNEVTFHFLECIFVHLYNLKSALPGSKPTNTIAYGTTTHNEPSRNLSNMDGARRYNQYMPPSAAALGGTMTECQKRVQAIFEEPASLASEVGISIDEVVRRMVGFARKQVIDAIDFLVNEGLVYSTIDDDHYKSTNG
eukprot:c39360_g1_i1 orf=289-1152(-)